MKHGKLLKPLRSKYPGAERYTDHRVGTWCKLQRHSSDPGMWVLYFGKQYALVPAQELPETVEIRK